MSGAGESFLRNIPTTEVCVEWPLSTYRNGYGQCWLSGRLVPAHRASLIIAKGDPPSPSHQAAHRCGNRICVNPLHLRWLTQSENELDKRRHGTAQQGENNGAAKLTVAEVRIIKALIQVERDPVIAARYGVDRKTISAIRHGRTWRAVQPASDAEVEATVAELASMEVA